MISNDPPKLEINDLSVSKYFSKNNVKVGDDLTLLFFTKKINLSQRFESLI